MDLHAFQALRTPLGGEVLLAAQALMPDETNYLAYFTALSRTYPPELCRAALETAILRLEAKEKFPSAEGMFFTRTALEQATHWEVSRYRSERFHGIPHVFDLGCSIGSDTAALAAFAPTTGIDLDPLRLSMAQANLQELKPLQPTSFIQADLSGSLPVRLNARNGLFFDPARRDNQRRTFTVEDYQPPLSVVQHWLANCPNLGVKISPGVQIDEIDHYHAELEFISLRGELKEAVLWFGNLQTVKRRATILPGPHSYSVPDELLDTIPGLAGKHAPHRQVLSISEPRGYLIEPDPAILRAGFIQALGLELDASQLDPDIAYLTSDQLIETPFARAWKIETWMPFNLKELRATLRQKEIGSITVKKRGSPIQPDELIRLLRIGKKQKVGRSERILVLTHLRGRPIVIFCLTNP